MKESFKLKITLKNMKTNKEICIECGESVAMGSGKFVNRIPDFDDYKTRKENGHPYPKGEWICIECDSKTSDD